MFDKTAVENALYGLVGFRQPFNPTYAILDAANLISRSGEFVNDNPYAKIQSVKENQDYADITDADFNLLLKRQQEASIASVCNDVFDEQDFREGNYVYKNPINKVDTTDFADGFVGFRIRVTSENNVAFCIQNILTDFSGTGNVEILLYCSEDKSAPIQSQVVAITTDRQLVELNWVVNNTGGIYKGEYYLGYISDATTPDAYKREYNASSILSLYSDLCIDNIMKVGHSGLPLFDLSDVDGNSDYIGLNPNITVYSDYTHLIINSQKLFARAINLDMSIRLINIYIASFRSNQDERKSKGLVLALQQVNGQDGDGAPRIISLLSRLKGEISGIRKQIEKLKVGYFGTGIFVHTMK